MLLIACLTKRDAIVHKILFYGTDSEIEGCIFVVVNTGEADTDVDWKTSSSYFLVEWRRSAHLVSSTREQRSECLAIRTISREPSFSGSSCSTAQLLLAFGQRLRSSVQ